MIDSVYKWRRFLVLPAALILAALFAACGGEAEPLTIRLQDNTFETNWIENAIAKFIVEKGYGHMVEEVVVNTVMGQTALEQGDIDINIEAWPGNFQEWWDKVTTEGSVVELGDIYGGGDQFWVVPTWVAEEHNVKTIEDLKRPEIVKLFEDPEDRNKGIFYNCIIGWQCTEINRAKFTAYGLDEYYNVLSPGTAAALDAALIGAQKTKDPVFGYYWAPTSIFGGYDWHVLEEPAWNQACWDELMKAKDDIAYKPTMGCAYETQPTKVAAHKSFLEKPPELVDFFRKINVGTKEVSAAAAWGVENETGGEWEKVAIYYLQTYEDRWTTWVTPEAAQKVKAALPAAGS